MAKRIVRGIRDSIPPGHVIGRVDNAEGPAQLIGMRELVLAQQAVMPNGQLSKLVGATADFGFFFQGKPAFSNMVLATIKFTTIVQLPANLLGSEFVADSPPTGSYTVTLLRNGSSIGSITFAATTGTPSVTFTVKKTFNVGDTFTIQGPATADAGIQDISFNFAAIFA